MILDATGDSHQKARCLSRFGCLEGVGYPMATAILDILDPGVWPVMDRWAVITVFGTRPAATRGLAPGGSTPMRTRHMPGTWLRAAQRRGVRASRCTNWTRQP